MDARLPSGEVTGVAARPAVAGMGQQVGLAAVGRIAVAVAEARKAIELA